MGYTSHGTLEQLGNTEPMLEALRRTAERVGPVLRDRVKEHTPVAKPPNPAIAGEWLAARKRAPGTLKESWQVGQVTVLANGRGVEIPVFTNDPIAPNVEWPTLPHIIVPKRAGGLLRFWNKLGDTIYATIVHHTGTKGSYMLATALVEMVELWQEIGAEEMERWARDQAQAIG